MILKSPNLATYVVGAVFVAIGSSAMSLISTILTADLIDLKVNPSLKTGAARAWTLR